ncbi:MAG TPA: hypothetical protein PLP25_07980 [Candidatus Limiplasma sp.]|nr:hypothetical protein [Candidatus Limiplasma sp.]HPS81780.1 hypothetical protein [Candidatus Limiplasma sp.]
MQFKRSYRFLRGLVRITSYRMRTEWAVPFTGEPSVFICNHAGALGPIDICAKFPLADSIHPWMNAQVLSARETPAYVRQDYWWKPGSRLAPFFSATLPYLAAAILPPILRTAPTVPVYHDVRVMKTFRESLRLLSEGEHLVIFPEQPSGYQAHSAELNRGFMQIAPAFARATGKGLLFWPVCIDYRKRVFRVAEPLRYDVSRTLNEQIEGLLSKMRSGIQLPKLEAPAPSRPQVPAPSEVASLLQPSDALAEDMEPSVPAGVPLP